jgi:hypothetical protein
VPQFGQQKYILYSDGLEHPIHVFDARAIADFDKSGWHDMGITEAGDDRCGSGHGH